MNFPCFTDNNTMDKCVNFEDSLFILMMRIRMIRDTLTLDAVSELFLEKTLDDIFFTDQILGVLLGNLEENYHLIERAEILEHFSELEWQFNRLLQSLLAHDGGISIREIPAAKEKILACRNNSLQRQAAAEKLSPAENSQPHSPIVSSDEINELLKAL